MLFYKKLEEYIEDVIDMCSAYGVTTSDITIDNSSFTVEELNNLYDMYLLINQVLSHF